MAAVSLETAASAAAGAVLAAVFIWAAVAKLRSPERTAQGMVSLGLPAPRSLALIVPLIELAIAAGLFAWRPFAARAAIVMLVAFTAILVVVLRRGLPAKCACFGAGGGEVSPWSVARNGLLLALAVLAL